MTDCKCTYPDDADCPVHGDEATLALGRMYTASEVKVLTEAALRLGRKEAGEEIAAALVKAGDERSKDRHHRDDKKRDHGSTRYAAYLDAATIARNLTSDLLPKPERHVHVMSCDDCRADLDMRGHYPDCALDTPPKPSGAASDATSGVPGHQEVSEAVRSPQGPCGHPDCPCGIFQEAP